MHCIYVLCMLTNECIYTVYLYYIYHAVYTLLIYIYIAFFMYIPSSYMYTIHNPLYYTIKHPTLYPTYTRYAECTAPINRQDGARQPQQPGSVVQGQFSIVYVMCTYVVCV